MNKHEELVKRIAEEMAKAQYNELFATFKILPPGTVKLFSELTSGQKEMMIVRTLPAARIAVKHMAEAASLFLGSLSEYGVNKRLREHGFIPDDTVTRKVE